MCRYTLLWKEWKFLSGLKHMLLIKSRILALTIMSLYVTDIILFMHVMFAGEKKKRKEIQNAIMERDVFLNSMMMIILFSSCHVFQYLHYI